MALKTKRSQPFTIFTDFTSTEPAETHRLSMSPSPYDADNGLSSDDNDSILPSIESYTNARRSSAAFTSVSSIPPSLPYDSDIKPYTPQKGPRIAFRSPSSVRALQMGSPPPFRSPRSSRMESPMSARRQRGGTPSSMRSGSVLHNEGSRRHMQQYDEMSSPSRGSTSGHETPSAQQMQSPARIQGPLVLLHVTVLPCPGLPYSAESLGELAPSHVLKNWHVLQEKLSETVLSRGVLIPHPGEEFDMLEEHLLETLGLCIPRILNCGHFHAPDLDSDDDSGNDSGVSDLSQRPNQVRALCERPHSDSFEDERGDNLCEECDHTIRLPGKGIGSGSTRWDIKIYAANGLMRAGAWSAAWREMERVDVEIEPWIPEDIRRALDLRLDQEEDGRQRQHEELEKLRFDVEVVERLRMAAEDARKKAEGRVTDLMAELETASIVPPLPAIESPIEREILLDQKRREVAPEPTMRAPSLTPTSPAKEIPLSTLLKNYLFLLAQDRRNIALGLLSVLVILLSIRLASPQAATIAPLADFSTALHSIPGDVNYSDPLSHLSPISLESNSSMDKAIQSIGSTALHGTPTAPIQAMSIASLTGSAEVAKESAPLQDDAVVEVASLHHESSDTPPESALPLQSGESVNPESAQH